MIDKKLNKLKILPLALLSPLLLANSPVPRAEPEPYDNYSYTTFNLESEDDEYKYYSTTISNSGNGYISLDSMYLKHKSDNNKYLYFSDLIDYNELIPPQTSYDINFSIDKNIDISNYEITLDAYVEYIDDVVSNIQITHVDKTSHSIYDDNDVETKTFTYSLKLSFDVDEQYTKKYYSCIYEVSMNGETHYYFGYSLSEYFNFSTSNDVKKDEISITNMLALEEERHSINFDGSKLLESIGITVLAITLGIPLTAGIVVAIIFIIKGIKNKRKYKQNNK